MTVQLLFAWWNLIFVVPFGVALLYLGLYVFTGLTFGDADLDHDLSVDHEVDVAHDFDADHDVDADHDHDVSIDDGGMSFLSLLALIGVGRVPLSLVLMILLILWGSIGFALNQLLAQWIGATAMVGVISMPATMAVSLVLTGLIARVVAKVLPTNETYARKRSDLVGTSGEAILPIDAGFGLVTVRDAHGDLFQVPCRVAEGEAAIAKGTRVVLFEYDAAKSVFYVAPYSRSNAVPA
jgi:membrane protein implicated in regulation of membrane protease activity